MNQIAIELSNGYKLIAEQNTDPNFNREIFVGIIDPDGGWHQDLAIIRNSYTYEAGDDAPVWEDGKFNVMVFGDENDEDYTESFDIGLYHEED